MARLEEQREAFAKKNKDTGLSYSHKFEIPYDLRYEEHMAWLGTEFYYYPASAPCRAVHLVIKALKVDCEEKVVDLLKAENKRPWFVKLNMLQEVPVFNSEGFVLTESRAIMMFLCNKYCDDDNQHLYPLVPEDRGRIDRLLFFDLGNFQRSIKEYFKPKLLYGEPPDPVMENALKQNLFYLEGFLEDSKGPYICGEKMTIADFSFLASLTELEAMEYNFKCYGDAWRYYEKLKDTVPNYKAVCEPGIKMMKARIKQVEEEHKKEVKKQENKKLSFSRK